MIDLNIHDVKSIKITKFKKYKDRRGHFYSSEIIIEYKGLHDKKQFTTINIYSREKNIKKEIKTL